MNKIQMNTFTIYYTIDQLYSVFIIQSLLLSVSTAIKVDTEQTQTVIIFYWMVKKT
jgi:hypothetical protein